MWPVRILETYKLSDTEIAAEWFESGEFNILPVKDQRVYDSLFYLEDNFSIYVISKYLQIATLTSSNAFLCVSCLGDAYRNDAVEVRRYDTELEIVLEKPVKKAIISRIFAAVKAKEQAKVDAEWALPTTWGKSKNKKKAK